LDRNQQQTPTLPVLSTAGHELQNRLRDSASSLMLREQGIYQRHHLLDFSETKHGFFFGLPMKSRTISAEPVTIAGSV
jgi:hypothetical protein